MPPTWIDTGLESLEIRERCLMLELRASLAKSRDDGNKDERQ